jgi:hypothetical protein
LIGSTQGSQRNGAEKSILHRARNAAVKVAETAD